MDQKIIETDTTPEKNETISSSTESPLEPELLESQVVERIDQPRSEKSLEGLLFKNDEQQDLSLQRKKTQTNLSTSQWWVLSKEDLQEKQLNNIIAALEKAGLNDDYIMSVIKEGIESAVFQGPKGEILRDRTNINKLIDKYFKLKRYYKSDTIINVVNGFMNPPQLY